MPTVTLSSEALLALVALGGVVVLAGVCAILAARLGRLRRAYGAALDTERGEDLFSAVERLAGGLAEVRSDLVVVHGNTERLRDFLRAAVSRVAVVRYDAFDDMGGALSFSAALLDEHADGVVLSAINGRTETRTYAKPIRGGASEFNLSPEEVTAIEQAMSGTHRGTAPTGRSRRRRAAS